MGGSVNSVISVFTEITELLDFGQAFYQLPVAELVGWKIPFMFVAAPSQGIFLFIVELLVTTFGLSSG